MRYFIIFIMLIITLYAGSFFAHSYFKNYAKEQSIEFCQKAEKIKYEAQILQLLKTTKDDYSYRRYTSRQIANKGLLIEKVKYTSSISVEYTSFTPKPIYLCFLRFKDGILADLYTSYY